MKKLKSAVLRIINKWPGRFTFGTGTRRSQELPCTVDIGGEVVDIEIDVNSVVVSIMTTNNMQPKNNFGFGKASSKKPDYDIEQGFFQSIFFPLPRKRKAVICMMEHFSGKGLILYPNPAFRTETEQISKLLSAKIGQHIEAAANCWEDISVAETQLGR